MAVTAVRQYESAARNPVGLVKFDQMSGLAQVTRTYQSDADPEEAAGDLGAAATDVTVTIDGTPVACRLVDRTASRLAEGRSEVKLTYEGLRMGFLWHSRRTQGETERLRVSLDSPPQQFDPDGTGGMRNVPLTTWTMRFNESAANVEGIDGRMDVAALLVGCVNPQNWDPGVRARGEDEDPDAWQEGYWLFSAATFERQRCGDYVCDYIFEHRVSMHRGQSYMMHVAPWSQVQFVPTASAPGGPLNRMEIRAIGSVRTPQRYPVAGVVPFAEYQLTDLGFGTIY